MKKLTKGLLAAATVMAATSATAFVDTLCPIIGVDYQQVWMKGKDFGNVKFSNALPKSYPGASVYVGSRFCEYLGLELGWDWAAKKTKNFTGADLAIDNTPANAAARGASAKSSVKRQGTHLDLLTYVPVADCFELMFGAGIGYVTAKTELTSNNSDLVRLASSYVGKTHKAKSMVGRIRLGGNYMFNECIGARALLGWESTNNLRASTAAGGTGIKFYPYKDSLTAALGLFYKF